MIFRRIVFYSLMVGLLVGSFMTVLQSWTLTPIILSAESFESEGGQGQSHHHHGHADHHHGESWAPSDGVERTFFTGVSNVFAAIGYAAILMTFMSFVHRLKRVPIAFGRGFIWGAAGFVVFFLVPGIGLPPEIPGVEAAALEHRQSWWLFAVFSAGIGLTVLVFSPNRFKLLGIAVAMLPLLFLPKHPKILLSHTDPQAVSALTELHQSFVIASSLNNLIFWLCIGVLSAWFIKARVHRGMDIVLNEHSISGFESRA